MSSGIYIWHPYEHHRNSVWLILQWKRAAERVCHLFWSVARKAKHIYSLVWASSRGWMAENPSEEHWEKCTGCWTHWSRTCRSRGGVGYKAAWLGREPPAVFPSPLLLPPSLLPCSDLASNVLLGWLPLFAVFPLMNFVFCHKLILRLAWMKI